MYSEFNLPLGKFQFHLGICIDKLRTLQYVVVVLYELKWFVETCLNYRTHSILYHLNVLLPIMITFHYVAYAVEVCLVN